MKAILMTLQPGAYATIVSGMSGGTGVGLIEVYDLDQAADSKLANISTRGFVQGGANVMIGSLIVLGDSPTSAIVRAIGPSLPVAGALQDPTLELRDGEGNIIAANVNWKSDQKTALLASELADQKRGVRHSQQSQPGRLHCHRPWSGRVPRLMLWLRLIN